MARLSNIKLHQGKKRAIAPEGRTITPLNARFTPTTAEEALDVRSTEAVDPKSQTIAPIAKPEYNDLTVGRDVAVDPTKAIIAPIEDYKFKTWEEAEKFGKISQKNWAASRVRDMVAAGQNPGEYHNLLALIGDSETPEEKRKRERREAVGEAINGLGNLIGNVANLYYAPRSGYSIDLNTMDDKRRERMERIQAKRDALDNQRQQMILNAKIGDIKAEREAKIAAEERAWKIKYDAYMKKLDNAHKIGQIDAQTKAKLAEQAAKAKSEKELESFKQNNRIALKTTPSYGENKVLDSVKGDDGNIWTRNTKLTPSEIKQIAMSSRNYQDKSYQDRFRKTTVDADGQRKTGDIDYNAMAAKVIANGEVPTSVLKQMGFKTEGKKDSDKENPSSFNYNEDEEGYDINNI
jgi:hypothetical protein